MALAQGCPSFNANDLLQSGKDFFISQENMPSWSVNSVETPSATIKPLFSTQFLLVGSKWQYVRLDDIQQHRRSPDTIRLEDSITMCREEEKIRPIPSSSPSTSKMVFNGILSKFLISFLQETILLSVMWLWVRNTLNLEDFIWNFQGDGSVLATVDVPATNIISNQQYDVAVFFSGLDSDARGFSLRLLDDSFVNSTEKTLTIHF